MAAGIAAQILQTAYALESQEKEMIWLLLGTIVLLIPCMLTSCANLLRLYDMPKHNDESTRELLEELRHLRHEIKELTKSIMIAQNVFDTSLTNLTGAVAAAASALATTIPTASTPDTVVQAYVAGVDAQTVALASATPPPVAAPAAK